METSLPTNEEFLANLSLSTKMAMMFTGITGCAVRLGRPLTPEEDRLLLSMDSGYVPAHWTIPIHVALVTWCDTTHSFEVLVRYTMTTKEYNRFVLMGRTVKGL